MDDKSPPIGFTYDVFQDANSPASYLPTGARLPSPPSSMAQMHPSSDMVRQPVIEVGTPSSPAPYHSISQPWNVVTTGLLSKNRSRKPSAEQPSVPSSDQPLILPSDQPLISPSDQPLNPPHNPPSNPLSIQPSGQLSIPLSYQPPVPPSDQPAIPPSDHLTVPPSNQSSTPVPASDQSSGVIATGRPTIWRRFQNWITWKFWCLVAVVIALVISIPVGWALRPRDFTVPEPPASTGVGIFRILYNSQTHTISYCYSSSFSQLW